MRGTPWVWWIHLVSWIRRRRNGGFGSCKETTGAPRPCSSNSGADEFVEPRPTRKGIRGERLRLTGRGSRRFVGDENRRRASSAAEKSSSPSPVPDAIPSGEEVGDDDAVLQGSSVFFRQLPSIGAMVRCSGDFWGEEETGKKEWKRRGEAAAAEREERS